MEKNQNADLDLEIDNLINDMDSITNSNHKCLKKGDKVLNKIEKKRLPQIENEIKKSNWFSKGIKSTGSWIKNIFTTPKMEKIDFKNENEKIKKEKIENEKISSVDKIRKMNQIIQSDQVLAKNQNERIDKIRNKINKKNEKIRKINKKIR